MIKNILAVIVAATFILSSCSSHKHKNSSNHKEGTKTQETHQQGKSDKSHGVHNHEGHDHGTDSHVDHNHLHFDSSKLKEYGITTTLPEERFFVRGIQLTGSLKDNIDLTYDVTTRSEGIVEKFHKNIGDKVKKGTPLYTISSPELLEKKSAFVKAFQNYRLKEASYQRGVKLNSMKGIQKSELQRRETQYKTSMAELFSLEGELNSRGIEKLELKRVRNSVIEGNNKTLARFLNPLHRVKASAAGTVVSRHSRIGENLEKSKVVFTISDTSRLWGIFDATREKIKHIVTGKDVVVKTDIFPNKTFPGKIITLMEKMDPQLRTLKVRVEIQNPNSLLKPNMFVTASIENEEAVKKLAIPSSAVIKLSGIDGIFLQDGDGFKFKAVEKVTYDSKGFAFIDSLGEEDLIVTKGAFYIKAEYEIKLGGTDPHAGHNH